MKLKKMLIVAVSCMLIMACSLTAFAAEETDESTVEKAGNIAYDVDPEPICEMEVVPYANRVTESEVFYGAQLYAEGRLLCIETMVTVMNGSKEVYHYTRASVEHKETGAVLCKHTEWGYGEVHSNIYNITDTTDRRLNYKGRVYYGW